MTHVKCVFTIYDMIYPCSHCPLCRFVAIVLFFAGWKWMEHWMNVFATRFMHPISLHENLPLSIHGSREHHIDR